MKHLQAYKGNPHMPDAHAFLSGWRAAISVVPIVTLQKPGPPIPEEK